MNARSTLVAAAVALMTGVSGRDTFVTAQLPPAPAMPPAAARLAVLERHLTEIRMLIDTGENAEAHVSPDGRTLVFAANRQQKTRGDADVFTARWKP